LNISVFWDVMLYGLVDSYQFFTLKMKVQVPLEHNSLPDYIVLHPPPPKKKNSNLRRECCENLRYLLHLRVSCLVTKTYILAALLNSSKLGLCCIYF
jgi:hypothetical protein